MKQEHSSRSAASNSSTCRRRSIPGIDYAVHAVDPDGHVMQLYYYMEQIGWDGKPRHGGERRKVQPGVWPETLPAMADTYGGETFWGPIG